MFGTPVDQIAFEQLETFCQEYAEGVLVEYKSFESIKIPKAVSSFANTMGGLWIVGVHTNPTTNKPILPIVGLSPDDAVGIKDRIINACVTGIYPPLAPAVGVVNVPGSRNVVIVVRVEESLQAPHAVDQGRKVYIRTSSQSNPIDLAEIDRIEYFFERRQAPERKRQMLAQAALNRCDRYRPPPAWPWITVIVGPPYPYRPLCSLDVLWQFASETGRDAESYLGRSRRISGGVASALSREEDAFRYLELNEHGLIVMRKGLRRVYLDLGSQHGFTSTPQPNTPPHLYFPNAVQILGRVLALSEALCRRSDYFGSLQIDVLLSNVERHQLFLAPNTVSYQEWQAVESEIRATCTISSQELRDRFQEIVQQLFGQLLWAFDFPMMEGIDQHVRRALEEDHFLQKRPALVARQAQLLVATS